MNTDTNNLILRLQKGYYNYMKNNNVEQNQNRKKITTQNKTKKVSDECINWVKNINKCLENCETFNECDRKCNIYTICRITEPKGETR